MNTTFSQPPLSRRAALRLAVCALAAPAVSFFTFSLPSKGAEDAVSGVASAAGLAGRFAATPPTPQSGGAQRITPSDILEPAQLATLLSPPAAPAAPGQAAAVAKPVVICVGFKFLYDAAHIPGSLYLGPGREGNGIVALANWGGNARKNRLVVLYCGCCPWTQCPNILPAFTALKNLGFSQLKVLRINQTFAADWVTKGFPTQKRK